MSERSGWASVPPSAARAVAATVSEYRVSGRQWSSGAIRRFRPASSHENWTAVSGTIRSAAATEAGSIGASKERLNGRPSGCPVVTASTSRASTWRGSDAGMALVRLGGRLATTTSATTALAPIPAATLRTPARPSVAR